MISGEVLGQRPMSQRKDAMESVKKLSETDDLILRPLSAKLLNPTKPEIEGWVDRERLLDISGRNRQRQLQLAKQMGLKDFESPGGGCLLTEIQFSNKLRDFVNYDKIEVDDIDTLKAGRHLRLPNGAKLIIGRNQDDNLKLEKTKSDKYLKGRIANAIGPLCLFQKDATDSDKQLATNLILTYGKTNLDEEYNVIYFDNNENLIFTKSGKKFHSKEIVSQYFI